MKTAKNALEITLDRIADALENIAERLDRSQLLNPPSRFVPDERLPDHFEQTNDNDCFDKTKPENSVEVPRELGNNK